MIFILVRSNFSTEFLRSL